MSGRGFLRDVNGDGLLVVPLILLVSGIQQKCRSDHSAGAREGSDAEPEQLVLVGVPPLADAGLGDGDLVGVDGLLGGDVLGHDRPPFQCWCHYKRCKNCERL